MIEQSGVTIALQTGLTHQACEIRSIRFEKIGSNFYSELFIRSAGFEVARPFWFEPFCLIRFLEGLKTMDASLAGHAVLQPLFEEDHVDFEMQPLGKVRVSGEISDRDDPPNALIFGFITDQTCLKPFISDLAKVAASHAAA